ncbi:hypothetical protein BH09ACT12_BH09ACT12_19810 [soil metagenome]
MGLGAGTTACAWVVWRLVHGDEGGPGELLDDSDLKRFLAGILGGSAVTGSMAAATSLATGWGPAPVVGVAAALSHLAAQLVVLPFFLRLSTRPALAERGELTGIWVATLVVTPLVFSFEEVPALVFLVIPTLVWGATRMTARQALWQVAAVSTIALTVTQVGYGPFGSGDGGRLGANGPNLFSEFFIVACVLGAVPLLVNIGKQAEIALDAAAERENLQKIGEEALSFAIVGTDASGRITFFNRGARTLLGYEPDEVVGKSVLMLYSRSELAAQVSRIDPGHDVENDPTPGEHVLTDLPRFTSGYDLTYVRKDGEERTHATSVVRRVDGRGASLGYVITYEDVTERVRVQDSLVAALAVERNIIDRLSQVEQIKQDLISTISHELRTPVTNIVGYLELLEDEFYGALNDRQLRAMARVTSNSDRLLALLDKLLTLSRLESESPALLDERVDLAAILQSGFDVAAAQDRIGSRDVQLELPDTAVPFLGDAAMLELMIVNLVDNAIKFTPAPGSVTVRLTATDEAALLEVFDTGIGIPEDEQDQLGTRFFRSSLTKEDQTPGSGLGLSIAGSIVGLHGGSLTVESASGEGTLVRVRLPRRTTRAATPGSAALEQPDDVLIEQIKAWGEAVGAS